MQLFYKGLATGNYNQWQVPHFNRWKRMLYMKKGHSLKYIGVEWEHISQSSYDSEYKQRMENFYKSIYANEKHSKNVWTNDWIREKSFWYSESLKQFEVHALIEISDPVKMTRSIKKLIEKVNEFNIYLDGSFHWNIESLFHDDSYIIKEDIYGIGRSSFTTIMDDSGLSRCLLHNDIYGSNFARLENKNGIASNNYLDWIRQIVAMIFIKQVSNHISQICEKPVNIEKLSRYCEKIKEKIRQTDKLLIDNAHENDRFLRKQLSIID
jgi:hypothetical protein